MLVTLIILVIAVILFVSGKVRSDLVALCALVTLMLFDILSPEEALSGFSNPIVVMMIGLFVVGGGIIQTGLANMISNRIMLLAGTSPLRLYLLLMVTTSAIGAFVSNTGTVALMLPIVVSLAAATRTSANRLLMPLAFASSMGGMMTLIGTPPNLVISNELVKAGYGELSFFSFTPVGLIAVFLGTLTLWPLSKRFLSKSAQENEKTPTLKSLTELAKAYQLSKNLYRVRVTEGSLIANKKVQEMNVAQQYDVSILEVIRKAGNKKLFSKPTSQKLADHNTLIKASDVLYLSGKFENVKRFVEQHHLTWVDGDGMRVAKPFEGNLSFDEIGIAEVVVLSNSRLVNQKIMNCGFREKYHINILGIHRSNQYTLHNLKDETIHAGDALLVHGKWNDIARLSDETSEWIVVGQPLSESSKVTIDHKAPLAALIMVAMVTAMTFDILPAVTAVMSAAIAIILTGCLRNVEAAYKTIHWESVLLIGAMLPMSLALEKTGVSAGISQALASGLGDLGPIFLLSGIYLATSALTMFISNTATAVLFAPIAMQSAAEMGVSPYPFLFAVAVASSMCFASPFSTPPNALVMSAGRYTFMDYVRVGLPLQLLMAVVMILVLPFVFPF